MDTVLYLTCMDTVLYLTCMDTVLYLTCMDTVLYLTCMETVLYLTCMDTVFGRYNLSISACFLLNAQQNIRMEQTTQTARYLCYKDKVHFI